MDLLGQRLHIEFLEPKMSLYRVVTPANLKLLEETHHPYWA